MFSIPKASKTVLLLSGAIATAALSFGGYYLYKYLSTDEIDSLFTDTTITTLKELKEELSKIINGKYSLPNNSLDGTKCGEIAFRISNEINNLAQKIYDDKYLDFEEMRRSVIDNMETYTLYCQETLPKKMECHTLASKKVFEFFDDKIDIGTIERWIGMIEPNYLAEYANNFTVVNIPKENMQSNEELKEAYTYYINLLKEEYQLLSQQTMPYEANEDEKRNMMLFYSMMIKIKVDDRLYIKYKMTEETLRYCLKEKNIMKDAEFVEMIENMKVSLSMPNQ